MRGPRFKQIDREIESDDSLCVLLEELRGGNLDGLRAAATKNIAVVTDDDADCEYLAQGPTGETTRLEIETDDTRGAFNFETELFNLAPGQFYQPDGQRNYVFWSFVGLEAQDDQPIPPEAPASLGICGDASVKNGLVYQQLSRITGGYRYPTCGDMPDYSRMFKLMAETAVSQTQVPCRFAVPQAPNGEDIDPKSIVIELFSGEASRDTFKPVTTCGTGRRGLFVDALASEVVLCDAACDEVAATPDASLEIRWGCNLNIR